MPKLRMLQRPIKTSAAGLTRYDGELYTSMFFPRDSLSFFHQQGAESLQLLM